MSPDEQVALANHLMRHVIKPNLDADQGAVLLLFGRTVGSLMTYISNSNREDMRTALRSLIAKWDADDVEAKQ